MAEFFSHPIPAVVLLLGILVFVHELGHYLVGRWCGIAVEVFSIGFGPRILGFSRRGTEYRLSWIPLGGYVKFAGAHPSEDVPEGLPGIPFRSASLKKRVATIVAGPLANFLLAAVVYSVLGMAGIPHPPPVIGEIVEGSAAETAGLRYGDLVKTIDSKPVTTWRDLEKLVSASPGVPLAFQVLRGAQDLTLTLTPTKVETTDFIGRPVTIGRAGVALGGMPAILTITDANSAAFNAGLKTGDRIQSLLIDGQEEIAIKWYPQFLEELSKALRQGAREAKLTVAQAAIPGQNEGPSGDLVVGPSRQVTLDLSGLSPEAAGKDRELARLLGFTDSQLTVAEPKDETAKVLQKGDRLLAFNGVPLKNIYGLREQLIANTKAEVRLTVQRDLQPLEIPMQLKGFEAQRPEGKVTLYALPVLFWGQPEEPEPVIEKYSNPLSAGLYGLQETGVQTKALFANLVALVTGEVPLKALGGPMLIAKVAGDSARLGWQTFLGAMALISINLGVINLFPIPVLDGGQLVLMGAEALNRRPLKEAAVENFQKVGFAMILALVVLATYNDLSRFWTSMLESIVGIVQ